MALWTLESPWPPFHGFMDACGCMDAYGSMAAYGSVAAYGSRVA